MTRQAHDGLTAVAERGMQARIADHSNVVRDAVPGFSEAVGEIGGHRGGNVLHERPTRGDIEHLRAAANREQRKVLFHRAPGEIEFELVAPRLGVVHRFVTSLAIEHRIDVAAAGEQHTIEGL